MKAFLIFIASLLLYGCSAQVSKASAAPSETAPVLGCQISQVNDGPIPRWQLLAKAHLKTAPSKTHSKAYFSMGCFWGSEAMLASLPGVIETQVGYTGGSLPNPSYSAIGDHVETVEVTFEQDVLSYEQLLRHFWKNHNAKAKPIFRQYASGVFTKSDEQLQLAKRLRTELSGPRDPLLTAILPLETFYPAETNHQKYYLQQDKNLWKSLPHGTKLNSPLATKLNAVSGRAGDRAQTKKELERFGIGPLQADALFQRAGW